MRKSNHPALTTLEELKCPYCELSFETKDNLNWTDTTSAYCPVCGNLIININEIAKKE